MWVGVLKNSLQMGGRDSSFREVYPVKGSIQNDMSRYLADSVLSD